ncbi:MAG: dephospho-CoA kinase [Oscillospiraceae bacterium]|nr:dephospho-CoA kinase [Oscillospiraceae bacterium]
MYIIGITGGTGAGKTSALRVLERSGALVIDCDKLYHELLAENEGLKAQLGRRFEGVLRAGEIDRKRLGEIVFSDPSALSDLNEITHRFIGEEIERRLAHWERQGGLFAAIDAIALIESGRGAKCDAVVGVTAPEEKRLARIMKRDGITSEQAQQRIAAQKPDSFFRENCGYILENIYDTAGEFESVCSEFFEGFMSELA